MKLVIFTSDKVVSTSGPLKFLKRIIIFLIARFKINSVYFLGGHYAVTRSLYFGLKKLYINFEYNPSTISNKIDCLIVLEGVEELRKGLYYKSKGVVDRLVVGPNLVTRFGDFNNILSNSAIDKIIVPSSWVKDFYIDDIQFSLDEIKQKFIIWGAGVDHKYFMPNNKFIKNDKKCLIYFKSGDNSIVQNLKQYLLNFGVDIIEINYGSYNKNIYKEALLESSFMIFISESESQGLALFEAWSMNVPTFVYFENKKLEISGKLIANYSPAPYLNMRNGLFFNSMDEFINIYDLYNKNMYNFTPREFILKNFTDSKSANYLLKKIFN